MATPVVDESGTQSPVSEESGSSVIDFISSEILGSPLNLLLLGVIIYLLWKLVKGDGPTEPEVEIFRLPKMKKQDFTIKELNQYKGTGGENERILLGVNGSVYDVTRGRNFYGPGGPYACLAGRDASRGFATFDMGCVTDELANLEGLRSSEIQQMEEWEMQLQEKYDRVGKLLKPGEVATEYTDDEEGARDETPKSKDD